ncbi:MAG: laccase domain-containing protein [Deltaproteobacteria bacterium]
MSFILKNQQFTMYHSTKQDGNMGYDFGDKVSVDHNRENFLKKNCITGPIREIINCHSSNVALISVKDDDKCFYNKPELITNEEKIRYGIDGLLTFDNIAICGITGDCIPLAVCEPESNLHGLVHIGLLGGLNGIIISLNKLLNSVRIDPSQVRYYIGPSITVKNYNISKSGVWRQIGEKARKNIPDIDDFIQIKNGDMFFDTKKFVFNRLLKISSRPENIISYDYCTAEKDSLFYSHFYLINNNLPNARFLTIIK